MNAQPGKYLTFHLAGGDYGIELLKVAEIIRVMPITEIPRLPPAIKGVINLRGKIIPVMDLRAQFNMCCQSDSARNCIIVVQLQKKSMGLLVDSVSEVLDVRAEEIDPAPPMGNREVDTSFLLGIGKIRNSVKLLLNIDRIISPEDMEQIAQAA